MKEKIVGWKQKKIQGLSLRQRIYIISKSPIDSPSPRGHHQECLGLGSQLLFPDKQTLELGFVICHFMSLFHYLQNEDVNKTFLLGSFWRCNNIVHNVLKIPPATLEAHNKYYPLALWSEKRGRCLTILRRQDELTPKDTAPASLPFPQRGPPYRTPLPLPHPFPHKIY